MVRRESPPGFRQPLTYTGEGKGGPCPYEEVVVSSRQHFLSYLILISPIPPPRFKESLDIPIIHTMTAPPQHKQRYYYIFWSIATLAVVCGQIYVASSYKSLADALRLSLL